MISFATANHFKGRARCALPAHFPGPLGPDAQAAFFGGLFGLVPQEK